MPTRDDDDAAVAVSMYKAVNKAAPSTAYNEYCLFGDKGTVCSYTPRTTSPCVTSHLRKRQPTVRLAVAFFSFGDAAPLPWTASTSFTSMVDSTFIVHPAPSFVAMW